MHFSRLLVHVKINNTTKALSFRHIYGAINEDFYSFHFNIAISLFEVASTLYSYKMKILELISAQDFILVPHVQEKVLLSL